MIIAIIGRLSLGMRVVPYQPAIDAGYPDARTLAYRPFAVLVMLAGFVTFLVGLVAMFTRKRPNKAPEPTPTSVMPRANESGIE